MASCEHLQRTAMYFDGELAPGDEREAADHIAVCVHCQAVLSDAVGLDALLSGASPAVALPAPRRRWQLGVAAAALVAAAAIAFLVLRPKPPAPEAEPVALVLPANRSLEVRFTGEQLGRHRPYEAPATRAHEAIDVRALADLEKRGDTRDLVGALASAGELVRATEVASKLPDDPASQSDLAALALARGDAEGALDHAYRALARNPELTAATWNLALAAHQLRYWRVSRAAFGRVAARSEPGWAVEAKQRAALVDRELSRADAIAKLRAQFQLLVKAGSVRATITDPALQQSGDIAEFQRRSRSILEDETPIELAEVRRFPSHAWLFLYEALGAATPEIVEGLEPVAAELDRISRTTAASELAKRAVSANVKTAVSTRTKLARIATLLQSPLDTAARAELGRLAPGDPFVELFALVQPGEVPARCTNDAFALPCAALVQDLARRELLNNRLAEAQHNAELGRDLALRAHAPVDYQLLSDLHRRAGRNALARADVEEATLASP